MVFDGTQLGQLLSIWEQNGLFSIFLPFLLIFAVTFAILNKSKILGGKSAIDMIVAVVLGLLALQQQFLNRFFVELFPRLGMGIGVILTLVILIGLFMVEGKENVYMIIMGSIAFIVFLVVILSTQSGFSFGGTMGWWNQWGNIIVWGVILIGIIVAFSLTTKRKP